VLTGPDHLSAIATLSANVGSFKEAFPLGVRWGLGHSTGLLLVGIVLIVLSRKIKEDTVNVPDQLTVFFESLVGIFMLLLGGYGIRRAWNKRPNVYSDGGVPMQQDVESSTPDNAGVTRPNDGESYHHHHFNVQRAGAQGRNGDELASSNDTETMMA
jgi:hypothetical protein